MALVQKILDGQIQARRRHVMGRLKEKIARSAKGGHAARAKALAEIRRQMRIRAAGQAKRYARGVEGVLESGDIPGDVMAPVVIDPWEYVRRAGDDFDAILDGDARHGEGRLKILRAIIDAWQDVAMQINHETAPPVSSRAMPSVAI
jgi:hypothetical protein